MLLIFFFSILKELCATNIALNSKVHLCAVKELSEDLADGNKRLAVKISDMSECTDNIFLSIMLDKPYYVHYVVVSGGPNTKTNPSLDYFKVYTGENRLCSQFEKCFSSVHRGSGMRVNCMTRIEQDSQVQVRLIRRSPNILISEISVYTLAASKPEKTIIFYRGCFKKFSKNQSGAFVDVNKCWKTCFFRGFPLMAIEAARKCHCGLELPINSEVANDECDADCPDHEGKCGGIKAFSVYLIRIQLPYFHGCSNMSHPRKSFEGNISVSKCLKHCNSFPYAWLRDNVCGCLDKIVHLDLSPIRCSTPCPGDVKDICGGDGRATIYGTCLKTSKFLTCDAIFRCDGAYDKYGRCLNGCKFGFGGAYCIDKIYPGIYVRLEKPGGTVANTVIVLVVIVSAFVCYLLLPGKKELMSNKLTRLFKSKSTVAP